MNSGFLYNFKLFLIFIFYTNKIPHIGFAI